MIYASLFAVLLIHIYLFRNRGLLDPVSVFFLAFLYYSFLAPISMLLFGIYGVDFAGTVSYVPLSTINKASILFFVSYLGYSIGYYVFSRKSEIVNYPLKNETFGFLLRDNYARILLIFIFLVIFVLSTYFRHELLVSTDSYEGKISENYSSSGYAFAVNSATTLLSLIVNYFILNSRRFIVVSFVGIMIFILISIETFSKAPLIYGALCAFCLVHRFRNVPFTVVLLSLIAGSVVMTLFFMPAFSIYRATGSFEITLPSVSSFSLILSEAVGPFTIVHLTLEGYVSTIGYPLWESFVLWIPRAFWPGRPLDLAEGFARSVIANWQIGFGLGFSPIAEAYSRLGLLGSSLFMAMMGAVTAIMQSTFARAVPKAMRAPAILTVGGYVSVLALRNPFSALVTQTLQNWAPVVVVSLIAWELSRRIGSRKVDFEHSGAPTNSPGAAERSPLE